MMSAASHFNWRLLFIILVFDVWAMFFIDEAITNLIIFTILFKSLCHLADTSIHSIL